MEWTRVWPEKAGFYWFHGFLYQTLTKQDPQTYFVRALKTSTGMMLYSANGVSLRESDGCRGVWTEATVPTPKEFK